jgi:hypothetical protein
MAQLGLEMVKMKKLKKKSLIRGWEGLIYLFVGYANGKEEVNHEDGVCICIFKDKNEQQWEGPR